MDWDQQYMDRIGRYTPWAGKDCVEDIFPDKAHHGYVQKCL